MTSSKDVDVTKPDPGIIQVALERAKSTRVMRSMSATRYGTSWRVKRGCALDRRAQRRGVARSCGNAGAERVFDNTRELCDRIDDTASRRYTPDEGVQATGSRLMPWMNADSSRAGSSVAVRSGICRCNSSNATLISRRARLAPRQKCAPPPPNPTWGFGVAAHVEASTGRRTCPRRGWPSSTTCVTLSPAAICTPRQLDVLGERCGACRSPARPSARSPRPRSV